MSGAKRIQRSPKSGRMADARTPRAIGPGRRRNLTDGNGADGDGAAGEGAVLPPQAAKREEPDHPSTKTGGEDKAVAVVRSRRRFPSISKLNQKRAPKPSPGSAASRSSGRVRAAPPREVPAPEMSLPPALTFDVVSPDGLNSYGRKLRVFDKSADAQMDANVREYGGILIPLLISRSGMVVISGERRLASAKRVGLRSVPVVYVEDLSELQQRKFRIADNKLQEAGRWSPFLVVEIGEIVVEQPVINVEAMGFSISGADIVIGAAAAGASGAGVEAVVPPLPERAVSRVGDVFLVGDCVVGCGDARAAKSYRAIRTVVGGARASLTLTDVVFNLNVVGHVAVRTRKSDRPREFVMGSGELTNDEYLQLNIDWMGHARAFSRKGALVYSAIHARGLHVLETAARAAGLEHVTTCVWDKGAGGMGSFYRSQVEFYPLWKVPGAPARNNVMLGKNGRNRTTCWSYPGMNVGGPDRARLLAMHPTPKPVAMLREVILDSTARGEIVLDPFAGSGSTLIAAVGVGRRACLIDLDPRYVDTILRRAESELGLEAVHAGTGQSFKALGQSRLSEEGA